MPFSPSNPNGEERVDVDDRLAEQERVIVSLTKQIGVMEKQRKESFASLAHFTEKCDEAVMQLRGGTTDPREDPSHPGHILIRLGWEYSPDENDHLGTEWRDPEERGTGKASWMPLSMALAIVYRRLEERLGKPTWMERLGEDDDAGV